MLNLIPNVETLDYKDGFLSKKAVYYSDINCDKRVLKALEKLPFAQDGAKLNIDIIIKGQDLIKKIKAENWVNEEIYQEMIISAEGICLMAELEAKMSGKECVRLVDTKEWLNKFKNKWLQKNKPSELFKIEEMFTYLAEN